MLMGKDGPNILNKNLSNGQNVALAVNYSLVHTLTSFDNQSPKHLKLR